MTRGAESPLVAVVTPVFNGERYLKAAMECVQEQTYPNLIYVVLDNASTDSTPSIIEAFKGRRVPLTSQRNPSTIPLPNNWSAAVGLVPKDAKYFVVLCADDLIEADFVAKMVAVAESDPDIQLTGCMRRENETIMPTSLPKEETVFDGPEVVRSFLNKKSDDIPHMWGLFRRREEDFARDFYDDSMYMEDTDACLRAMVRGKFGFVHEPLYTFRLHPGSVTETIIKGSTHRHFDMIRILERWGPVVMSESEFRSCAPRHLRVIYRHMLASKAFGRHEVYARYREFLCARDISPSILDFTRSVVEWPFIKLARDGRTLRARLSTPRGVHQSKFASSSSS